MDRRSFFGRLTAGIAGAWAATRLPRTPELTSGSVIPDSSKIYPFGSERTGRYEQYFAVTDPFVGIAMEAGNPGDTVAVMIANLPGCRSVSKIEAGTRVVMGDLLVSDMEGRARAYEIRQPSTVTVKIDGRDIAETMVKHLDRRKL